jgi:hypothetical protein
MKVCLKLLQNEQNDINELKKAIKELDINKIDLLKSKLLKNDFDLIIDEKELPKEFNDYITPYTKLKDYEGKIGELVKKAKTEKKDILVLWGNYEEF